MEQTPTWLIANWKMHGDATRVAAYASELAPPEDVHVVFCPPATYLSTAKAAAKHARVHIGAQNCHHAASGAYTGEVSAAMLRDVGCSHVILGHSERRGMGEDCVSICAKAEAAMAAGLTPILCVGESRADYDAKQTSLALDKQLAPILNLTATNYLIAYEPVWAIGSNQTPTIAEIADAHSHIKSALGSATCVLYGGSVNAANGTQILALPHVGGALIGGASLEIESMRAVIACAPTQKEM